MFLARASVIVLCIAVAVVHSSVPAQGADKLVSANPAEFATELQAILEGLKSRASLPSIESHVARARALSPGHPVVDYAFGLVLTKRLQHDRAVASFLAALKSDPTYLPARQALFRHRLTRKDTKTLLEEMVEFADVVASPSVGWNGDQERSAAAEYLGRVVGFLSTPGIKLVEPAVLEQTEIAIEKRLGSRYVDAYYNGMNGLTQDREALALEIEKLADQKSERIQKQAADKIAKLEGRAREADEKLNTLQLTKEESKAQLDEELNVIDGKLDVLQKEYDSLAEAAERLGKLITQTNWELARIQTDLDARGANDAALRHPVPIIDVHRELIGYKDELAEVRIRAKEVAVEGGELLQARVEAAERHRKAKGHMLQESKSVQRWNAAMKKTSAKVKRSASAPVNTNAMRDRLTRPATFFPLDYDAEMSRLLQEQGVVTKEKGVEQNTQLQTDRP